MRPSAQAPPTVISDAGAASPNYMSFGLGGRLLVTFAGAGEVAEWNLSASSGG